MGYPAGFLWIPDYPSLSGKPYFLVYIGPFRTKSDAMPTLCEYSEINSSAYGIRVAMDSRRVTFKCR